MIHVVPILCLIATVFFLEIKLGKEIKRIDKELHEFKRDILANKDNISKNTELIKNINGEHLQ